jgi:hypothetical protein
MLHISPFKTPQPKVYRITANATLYEVLKLMVIIPIDKWWLES